MLANLKVPTVKTPNLKVMLVCACLPLVVAAGAIAVLVTPPADAARPSATVSIAAVPAHSVTPAAAPAEQAAPRSDLGQTTSERYNEMLQTLQSGDWFSQNGQPSQARSEYQKALKIAEALQHRQAQSVILTGLGRSYSEMKGGAAKGAAKDVNYGTAISFYQQALALSDTDPAEAGRIRANLANAYRQQGQTQLALTTYQQALADVAGDGSAEATIRQHIQVVQASLTPPAKTQVAVKPTPAAPPAVESPQAQLAANALDRLLDVVLDS
jgi:tetratricopeptide (TPR) repeat protein